MCNSLQYHIISYWNVFLTGVRRFLVTKPDFNNMSIKYGYGEYSCVGAGIHVLGRLITSRLLRFYKERHANETLLVDSVMFRG